MSSSESGPPESSEIVSPPPPVLDFSVPWRQRSKKKKLEHIAYAMGLIAGGMSTKAAARKIVCPYMSLHDRVSSKRSAGARVQKILSSSRAVCSLPWAYFQRSHAIT